MQLDAIENRSQVTVRAVRVPGDAPPWGRDRRVETNVGTDSQRREKILTGASNP